MNKDHRKENQQVLHEGKNYYHQCIHDLAEWWNLFSMRHLMCKCKRAVLITDGSMTRLTLTLAPMGMVAPWRCQEHHRPSSLIHLGMESKMLKIDSNENWLWLKTKTENWNKTKPYTYHPSFIAFTSGPKLEWPMQFNSDKNNMVCTMMMI